jgi:hypothetical protein
MTQLNNPVLDADWPHPDAIHVGDDHYLGGQWIGAEIGLFARVPIEAGGRRCGDTQGIAASGAVKFAINIVSDEGTS